MIHSQKQTSSDASKAEDSSTKMDLVTFSRNVLDMKINTHQSKFIRMIGSQIAMQDVDDSILLKSFQNSGKIIMLTNPKADNLFHKIWKESQ